MCPMWVFASANTDSETMQRIWLEGNMGVEGQTVFQIRISAWLQGLMNTPESTGLNEQKN